MNIITANFTPQYWAYRKDIINVFGYKNPTELLRRFKEFCEARPNYFNPCTPFLEEGDTQYNLYCFAHYYENRGLLDAGTRSLKFKDDLPRLIEAYSLHLLRKEVL